MADKAFNIALGRTVHLFVTDNTKGYFALLKVAQADATIIDHTTMSALLAAANTEANFTNYARKQLTSVVVTVDNTNDRVDIDAADITWTSAGGATNNTLVKAISYYENAAADASRVPQGAYDFAETTTGSDMVLQINANGFFRAQSA